MPSILPKFMLREPIVCRLTCLYAADWCLEQRRDENVNYTEALAKANNSPKDRSHAIIGKIILPLGDDQTIVRTMSNAQDAAAPLLIKEPLLNNGQVTLGSASKSPLSSPLPSTPPPPPPPLSSSPSLSSPHSSPSPPLSLLSPSLSPSPSPSPQQDTLDCEHVVQGVYKGATHTYQEECNNFHELPSTIASPIALPDLDKEQFR